MTDGLIRDVTGYNQETLAKVYDVLDTLGLEPELRRDIVGALLNVGILFRERYESEPEDSAKLELTPDEALRNRCLEWAWDTTRTLSFGISRPSGNDPFELAEKIRAYIQEGKV